MHISDSYSLLKELRNYYSVLDINGHKLFNYSNLYFDTPDMKFYKNHINGKLSRFKIRLRNYRETNENYIEVKQKNNREETKKNRFLVPSFNKNSLYELRDNISELVNVNVNAIKPIVNIEYKRVTLIKPDVYDKITFDYSFKVNISDGSFIELNNLAIIEHKIIKNQNRHILNQLAKIHKAINISISKYCLANVLTNPDVKYNSYKSKLITINKICNGINTKYPESIWTKQFDNIST
jgi:hypothetical protein